MGRRLSAGRSSSTLTQPPVPVPSRPGLGRSSPCSTGSGQRSVRNDHERHQDDARAEIIESRLIGLRQESDGTITLVPDGASACCLRGAQNVAPGSVPLARLARGLTEAAGDWLNGRRALGRIVEEHRAKIELSLPERLDWLTRGYDHKTAELIAKRQRVTEEARRGDPHAKAELTKVKDQQRQLGR